MFYSLRSVMASAPEVQHRSSSTLNTAVNVAVNVQYNISLNMQGSGTLESSVTW